MCAEHPAQTDKCIGALCIFVCVVCVCLVCGFTYSRCNLETKLSPQSEQNLKSEKSVKCTLINANGKLKKVFL